MVSTVLAPIDVEHETTWHEALPAAADIARRYGAELHVLYVLPPVGSALVGGFFPKDFEHRALETAKTRLADVVSRIDLGEVEPKLHVAHGNIYEQILAAADRLGADLVVLDAYRPDKRSYLLGPNAARVVRHARQSVLVIRR